MSKKVICNGLTKFAGIILTIVMVVGFLPLAEVRASSIHYMLDMDLYGLGFYKSSGDNNYHINSISGSAHWLNDNWADIHEVSALPLCTNEQCYEFSKTSPVYGKVYYEVVRVVFQKYADIRLEKTSLDKIQLNLDGYSTQCISYNVEQEDDRQVISFLFRLQINDPGIRTVKSVDFWISKLEKVSYRDSWEATSHSCEVGWVNNYDISSYEYEISCLYTESDFAKKANSYELDEYEDYYFSIVLRNKYPNDHRIDFSKIDPYQVNIKIPGFQVFLNSMDTYVDYLGRDAVKFFFQIGDSSPRTLTGLTVRTGGVVYYSSTRELKLDLYGITYDWKDGRDASNYIIKNVGVVCTDIECTNKVSKLEQGGVYYVKIKLNNVNQNDHTVDFSSIKRYQCGLSGMNRTTECVRLEKGVDSTNKDYILMTFRIGVPQTYYLEEVSASSSIFRTNDSLPYELTGYDLDITMPNNIKTSYNYTYWVTVYKDVLCKGEKLMNPPVLGESYYAKLAYDVPTGCHIDTSNLRLNKITLSIPGYYTECISTTNESDTRISFTFRIVDNHIVSFNENGHGTTPAKQYLTAVECITEPEPPVADGYIFGGWYKDPECNERFNFFDKIDCDLTLYAKWIEKSPKFTVQPRSGEAEEIGGKYSVDWTTSFDADYFNIYYLNNGEWLKIYAGSSALEGNLNKFNCSNTGNVKLAGNLTAEETTYKIVAYYYDNNTVKTVESNPFTVSDPVEYNVHFHRNYGTSIILSSSTVINGHCVERPKDPASSGVTAGMIFAGWYTEPSCKNEFDFGTEIKKHTHLYAKWIEGVTVEFNCSGTNGSNFSVPDSQLVSVGGKAVNPWATGFRTPDMKWQFMYWCKDEACTRKFDFNTELTENITLYAKWEYVGAITVRIEPNGYSSGAVYDLDVGKKFKPSDPSDDNYYLEGYYWDPECTEKFDLDQPLYDSVILYCKWMANPVLTFVSEGETVASYKIRYNKQPGYVITFPELERDGYNFCGWYKDEKFSVPYLGYSGIKEDTTVYAKWEETTLYTIDFDSRGGNEVPSQQVAYNGKIERPKDPVREGYKFTGWYYDEKCTEMCYFNSLIGRSFTLYAGWKEILHDICLSNEGVGEACLSATSAGLGTKVNVSVISGEVEKVLLEQYLDGVLVQTDITDDMSFVMPLNYVTVRVVFKEKKYKINVEIEGEGRASAHPGEAAAGTEITLDYVTSPDYCLYGWEVLKGKVVIKDNKFILGNEDVTVKAIFVPAEYTELSIKEQPESFYGSAGTMASFSVAAEGEGLKYQWMYKNSSGVWKKSNSTGSTTSEMSIKITVARDGQEYKCVITDSYNYIIETDVVAIHLIHGFQITEDPVDFTCPVGSMATFSVTTEGKDLKYQWQYNNGSGWKNSNSTGYDTDSMSIKVTAKRDGQKYRCVVYQGKEMIVSGEAVIHVGSVKLTITSDPSDFTGEIGSMAIFGVTAKGDGLSYQWQYSKDGVVWKNSSSSGYDSNAMTVKVTAARNGQMYRCVVTDKYGNSATSGEAMIIVPKDKPEPVEEKITSQPADYSGKIGSNAEFTVEAEGERLKYQWQYSKDGTTWKNSSSTGYDTASLSIKITEARKGQMYRCVITDCYGNTLTSDAALIGIE